MKYLLLLFLISCETSPKRNLSSVEGEVKGLSGINLDEWTLGFFKNQGSLPQKLKESILSIYKKDTDLISLYNDLLALNINGSFEARDSYDQIAKAFFAAKKQIRKQKEDLYTRQAAVLFQTLGEEALYALFVKNPNLFQGENVVWKETFYSIIKNCEGRVSRDLKVPICQGDVLVSKGGAGSSSFIARTSDFPGNFSHSTIAYVDSKNKLWLMESLIEDGTKLRSPLESYIKSNKKKLAVYRFSKRENGELPSLKPIVDGVDKFYDVMKSKVGEENLNNKPSFPYDFSMDAITSARNDSLFCSETVYAVYKDYAQVSDELNPYNPKFWSNSTGVNYEFSKNFLGFQYASVPAPSDVELNPNFDEVFISYNVPTFGVDRIDTAIIDDLFEILAEQGPDSKALVDEISKVGQEKIDPNFISKVQSLNIFPNDILEKIKRAPEGINYNQMLFFGLLDKKLVPEIRKKYQALEAERIKSFNVPFGMNELRVMIKKDLRLMVDKVVSSLKED